MSSFVVQKTMDMSGISLSSTILLQRPTPNHPADADGLRWDPDPVPARPIHSLLPATGERPSLCAAVAVADELRSDPDPVPAKPIHSLLPATGERPSLCRGFSIFLRFARYFFWKTGEKYRSLMILVQFMVDDVVGMCVRQSCTGNVCVSAGQCCSRWYFALWC